MTKIYDQHDNAFSHVSAYVILKDGEHVAKIALKFPKDGAGNLYAYVHYLGLEMVRDFAGGYGYDKKSAAVTHAATKIEPYLVEDPTQQWQIDYAEKINAVMAEFKAALSDIGGKDWDNALRDAGYTVLNAV
jgi:hypothetical protein